MVLPGDGAQTPGGLRGPYLAVQPARARRANGARATTAAHLATPPPSPAPFAGACRSLRARPVPVLLGRPVAELLPPARPLGPTCLNALAARDRAAPTTS